ncbi:PREDICTED: uncharacterized protein LOC109155728 [Ipomoea nil]|uniref:uncharacterized protein LOC109155728 n=1 Tax=Ipomoea nil TaxID=35883 RepID=UPI000901E8C3|nr:PREDICTED: uncharacterized protein LOC109155728 [Ipomoea nil]
MRGIPINGQRWIPPESTVERQKWKAAKVEDDCGKNEMWGFRKAKGYQRLLFRILSGVELVLLMRWGWNVKYRFQKLARGGSCGASPPRIMNFLTWNCRGLGNPTAVQVLADLVREKRLKVVFSMETFLVKSRMEPIRVTLGYNNMLVVDASGRSGGLALLWDDAIRVDVTGYSSNHIDTTVILDVGSPEFRLTGFYGFPKSYRSWESWNLLRTLASTSSLPWVVMGDFNDILHQYEKRGRRPQPQWRITGFRDAKRDCGLTDFPFAGYQFTWQRSKGTPDMVEEKLDRFLVTESWLVQFEGPRSLPCPYSDHLPLMLSPIVINHLPRRHRFCFDNMWLREPVLREVVEHSWGRTTGMDVFQRVELCSRDIWRWGRVYNKGFQQRIDQCRRKLEALQPRRDMAGCADYDRVEQEWLALLDQQHVFSRQRAKEHWWKDGDLNTKFFHNSIKARRRRNRVTRLRREDDSVAEGVEQVGAVMLEYYQTLFTSQAGDDADVIACIKRSITTVDNAMLCVPVSMEEFRKAVLSMHPDKSPGPDGFGPALKIDMSKAYDRVEWRFLRSVMLKMGFSEKWVSILMETVTSVKYHIFHEQLGPIEPGRGLCQGDPLSPYLFLMVVEGLSALIDNRMSRSLLHGVCLARGAPPVTHLLFADDCFLFMRANLVETSQMKEILDIYAGASGQLVNYDKSVVCFSANTPSANRDEVQNVLGVTPGDTSGREIEVIFNQYWWTGKVCGGTGLQWKAWRNLCVPKKKGGLGFRTLRDMNVALLGKQVWRLLTRPNSLVAQVYKCRHYPNTSILDVVVGHNPSFIWRGLVEAKGAIKQWAQRSIGDGRTTTIGGDPWLVLADDPYVRTQLHETVRSAPVSSLMNGAGTGWDCECVKDLFDERDSNLILNLPLASKVLPTRDALLSKRVACVIHCHMCGVADEYTEHLFRDCLHARAVWMSLQLPHTAYDQGDILDWFFANLTSLTGDIQCKFVMLCWGLWGSRNDSV